MTTRTTLRPTLSQEVSVTDATARNGTAFVNNDVWLFADQPCHIKLGGSDVEATASAGDGYDFRLPAGTLTAISLGGATHIAAIRESFDTTLYISELTHKAL